MSRRRVKRPQELIAEALAHELLHRSYSRKGPEVIWSTARFLVSLRIAGWEVWYGLTTGREKFR
jgi:hypothetical protein